MQKLGLVLLIIGIVGQLSAILWTHTSMGPICQNDVESSYLPPELTKLDRLIKDAISSIKHDFSKKPFDGVASYSDNEPHIPNSTADVVQFLAVDSDEKQSTSFSLLEALAHKWAIIVYGLVAVAGLLLALFARKKTNAPQWHVFLTRPGSLLTLERQCLTCGAFIRPTAKATSSLRSPGLWVIEIALNAPSRHRATKAIKLLALPVARRENNFVVIGPYKQKQDAARVLKDLSDIHGVRGWILAGN